MPYCIDTNILRRWAEPGTPMCELAREAVKTLRIKGEIVVVTPQNLIEFWSGATRPAAANGLGMTPPQADNEIGKLERLFPLLEETPAIYPEWRRLVVAAKVSGAKVHDARLAAVLGVHGITHILTFNTADFRRFHNVTAVHPADIAR